MSDMTYRDELIQVAAVAVAMIQDNDQGAARLENTHSILLEISDERELQNIQWGAQHHEPPMWLTILMEEVGEAAQAFLQETE